MEVDGGTQGGAVGKDVLPIVTPALRAGVKEDAPAQDFVSTVLGFIRVLTGNRPHLVIVAATLLAFAVAYWAGYLIRFEFAIPHVYSSFLQNTLPFVLLIKLLVFYFNGIYRILWAYVGLRDLYRILGASAFASGLVTIANLMFLPYQLVPRSVLLADGVLTFLLVGGIFGMLRSLREANSRREGIPSDLEPVFIVGAGDAGESLLREIQRNHKLGIRVVGFLDDAPLKKGLKLRGVPVLGSVDDAQRLAGVKRVKKAFIAIPSAPGSVLRQVIVKVLSARLAMRILPPISQLSAHGGIATQLREVSIEDLLRREPVRLDTAAIAEFVRNKKVLVTGAAGSIGSELCRQILDHHPAQLIALDWAESALHALTLELEEKRGTALLFPELGDVTDEDRVTLLFQKYRPDVVFHAAALKHVPILETHAREAVRVNIGGTTLLAKTAAQHGSAAFIMISTDKAVNPSSVMGATKRAAELRVRRISQEHKDTRFMAVRFGNVLGSNGSVVPIFRSQLAKGGPLTVTHPDMRRYFMTIPEAVQLVLQAAVLGTGGEIFVLDMGKPIRIADLAEDLIRLSGKVPGVDVKIEYTGLRPGEKLFEEIRLDNEVVSQTRHPQIFSLRPESADELSGMSEALLRMLEQHGVSLENLRQNQPN